MKTLKPILYPQADLTLVDGNYLPFIDSHDILPAGTVAQATTRTGEQSYIKLLAPYSKTPLGYLYTYEPVKTLTISPPLKVKAGEKLRHNNVPYEVLSVQFVPTVDTHDNYCPAHYLLEVAEIVAMQEPATV